MTTAIALCSGISTVFGVLWGVYVYCRNSKQALSERRSRYLEDLLTKFTGNKIRRFVCAYDSSDGIEELFRKAGVPNSEEQLQIEQSLTDIAHLCYLREKNAISKDEFCFFNNDVTAVLSAPLVQKYIDEHICAEGNIQDENHFRYLKTFMEEHEIEPVQEQTAACPANEDIGMTCGDKPKCIDAPIRESEFDMPTMIIKINRKYEGLKDKFRDAAGGIPDEEIYKAVKGRWRVNPENAKKYKVVLAVAESKVCGVYLADKWEKSALENEGMRYQFTRRLDSVAETRERERFLGRSVKNLFPRGASNPIRYYASSKDGQTDVM